MAQAKHKKVEYAEIILRAIMIMIGAGFAAVAIELFLVPNQLIDGGVIGVALILDYLTQANPYVNFAIFVVVLNLPFFYFGYKQIGKTFVVSSIFGTVCLAIIESSLHHVEPIIHEPILAAVFGGLLLGIGVGLVIRNGGTMDGTEILGILLTKRLPFSVGEFVMFINVFIFIVASFILGVESAMYSAMAYFIAFKAIDIVTQGLDETKAVFIISDAHEEISESIQARLGRGTTKLHGRGGYTDQEKDVIFVVVTRLEITKLKTLVYEFDENAFLTIMNTHETKGGKFKSAIH